VGFDESLVVCGKTPTHAEKLALVQALSAYHKKYQASPDQVAVLEDFLRAYPDSGYEISLRLNLGLIYRRSGHLSRALSSFERSWRLSKGFQDGHGKALGDAALGQLAMTRAYLGRYEELEPLLKEAKNRKVQGYASEMLVGASEGLRAMVKTPKMAFLCGPSALRRIASDNPNLPESQKAHTVAILDKACSSRKGTSLSQLQEWSQQAGMENFQMAFRKPGAAVLMPSVFHWKVGHYAAILSHSEGRYRLEDSTFGAFGDTIKIDAATLDEESSGYFLIPPGPLPPGWRKVSTAEGQTVWGRGYTGNIRDLGATMTCDVKSLGGGECCPMTTWSVHTQLVSLSLEDTPVGGGPAAYSIPFTISYAQREASQPAILDYGNLGNKWTHNWLSFCTDNRVASLSARVHERGGGYQTYAFSSASSATSRPGVMNQATLTKVGTSFVRDHPDGSQDTFGLAVGNRYYLTQTKNPQGLITNINWDGQFRITSIVDPSNRVMTLDYELASDPLKITRVTDFAGRSAQFTYSGGQLASVRDILGLVSSYQYAPGTDFIHALTTPYGTTTFTSVDDATPGGANSGNRVFTATDPMGRTSRVEFRHQAPGIPNVDPAGIPVGMTQARGDLNHFRNSFVWEPHQLAGTGAPDYTKATIYHFTHGPGLQTSTGRLLESMKKPLERRIWYSYPSTFSVATQDIYEGNSNRPDQVGRILSDGTTQLTRAQYNSKGNVLQRTDAMGRVFDYGYAPNGIDLTSISTGGQTLFSATYDGLHNIQTMTNASGGTSIFTYNSRGQVETATNELGEVTVYGYTPTGNLSTIESPLQATTTFTYNGQEQLASATDSEGYTVLADHDEADRPSVVKYPDGTTETITYDRLDVATIKDRKDRLTTLSHDAVRRLTTVMDANSGVTTLGYGLEDAPTSLLDPMQRQTIFTYDLQQRLSTKQYAGGATQTTTYQNCCGRLRTITDALGHVKTFTYFLDDTLKSIDYSGTTPDVHFSNDPFLPRPLTMTDGQGTTVYAYIPVGSPGANSLASVTGPVGDAATFSYDIAGRMTGRTVNGASETQTFDPLWRTKSTTNALDTFTMEYLGLTGQVTGVNSTQGPNLQYTYGTNIADRRLAQIKNLGRLGQVHSQFDFNTNPVGEITRIIETHGTPTPTPTPTNTTTPTPGGDTHTHGNHNGNGHQPGNNGFENGNGHHKPHTNNKDKDKHGSVIYLPDSDDMRTGNTVLVLTLCGLLMCSTLGQPRSRRTLVTRLTSLGLVGTLTLQGCLIGNIDAGPNTSIQYDYDYDNLSQLIGVDINQTRAATFDFDPSGNLISLTTGNTTTLFGHNSLNQRISPGVNLYDAKGQTKDQNGRQFEWDDDGRMTAIVDGTHRSEFGYDGYGRRIKIAEFDNGNLTSKKLYWWLGGEIVCERDGIDPSFPLTKRYFGQGVVVGGEKLYYTMDQLGSVRELVDSAGVVRADYRYSTYGERTKVGGDLDSDFGFGGLFHHGPSGLDLATYRTYDSKMGRWISRDPLGEGVDYNLYRYCGNNPISNIDPSGLYLLVCCPQAVSSDPSATGTSCQWPSRPSTWLNSLS
jgi:RHS repeat-associated protein